MRNYSARLGDLSKVGRMRRILNRALDVLAYLVLFAMWFACGILGANCLM